jgi:hypothetical protein
VTLVSALIVSLRNVLVAVLLMLARVLGLALLLLARVLGLAFLLLARGFFFARLFLLGMLGLLRSMLGLLLLLLARVLGLHRGQLGFARLPLLLLPRRVLLPLARDLFFASLSLLRVLSFHRRELGFALLLLARFVGFRRGELDFTLLFTLRLRSLLIRAPLFFALLFCALGLPLCPRGFLSGELGFALLLLTRLCGRLLLAFLLLARLFLGKCALSSALTFDLLGLGALAFRFLAGELLARARQLGLLPFALEPLSGAFTSRLRVRRSSCWLGRMRMDSAPAENERNAERVGDAKCGDFHAIPLMALLLRATSQSPCRRETWHLGSAAA